MTDLRQQMEFLLEMDRAKQIGRQTYLSDGSRKENDAEHSWHMALMVFLLADYANEPIDVLKTMKMILLHDVIEIDAGDTYAYDEEGNQTKRARECAAADRIFGLLPKGQGQECRMLWEEFEAMETPEAKFANMLDKIQPLLLNDASGGRSWREHGIKKSQVLARNARVHEGSEELWNYARELIEKNVENGNLQDA
ncbi:MAG: HD domain-containing protein [Roseburia sp.]|jgi:putative hydrolase of HD superfamily|nr:HD domain-containing protein [Roseburia sp.]